MALSTIRKLTDEDFTRLAAAESRFKAAHGLDPERDVDDQLGQGYGESQFDASNKAYLRRLWLACFRRAVRHASADSTGWGYLGWNVK